MIFLLICNKIIRISHNEVNTLLYMFTFTISSHIVFRRTTQNTSNPYLLYYICFDKQNYSSFYGLLLNSFSSCIILHIGFGIGSIGQGAYRVNRFSLFRGDIEYYMFGISQQYENFIAKYLGEKLFGKIDDIKKVYMWNLNNVCKPNVFINKTR
ncbi:hypothetical protein MKW98_020455, partial [Papaver atlanticum]